MNGTTTSKQVIIEYSDGVTDNNLKVYIDVFDTPLANKWYAALEDILRNNLHLEKNYHFFGVPSHERDGNYLTGKMNETIEAINSAGLGYVIDDSFSMENTIADLTGPVGDELPGRRLIHERMNNLHRYFEDLQGTSGNMSPYFNKADDNTKWHIRQLNLLCHEYESWVLSYRKQAYAKEWMRPSELFCFLKSPRFTLNESDYESFGVDTIARPLGGVFVGVNKAVGKHHWEVFQDEEGRSIDELTTSAMRSQTEAAGVFDIEWANNPGQYEWMQKELTEFKKWLTTNGFDPNDKSLTIGHPQVGQVDLMRSFRTENYEEIWEKLFNNLNVVRISTNSVHADYLYNWSDLDYKEQQIKALK